MTSEARFEAVVEAFAHDPSVALPASNEPRAKFGSNALKVDGRIFAMLVRDEFVAKLPRERVAAAVAAGQGVPFDAGKGTPMKEWLRVPASSALDWLSLAREAMQFVRSRGRSTRA